MLLPGGEVHRLEVVEGMTLAELVAAVPSDLRELLVVHLNGTPVEEWEGLRLRAGDRVLLAAVPGGGDDEGKGILGAVLTIALAVVAGPAAGAVTGAAAGTTAYAVAQFAITMVGSMLINALVAPPSIGTGGDTADAKSYTFSGQSNAPRPFGACFVIYGQHKVMPPLANNVDVSNTGASSILSGVYDFGLGAVALRDIRIGDVPAENYAPELVVHTDSLCRDLQLAAQNIGYDQYALAMRQNDPVVVRTKIKSVWALLSILFPKGLFQALQKGGQAPHTAAFRAYYRPSSGGAWVEITVDRFYGAEAFTSARPAGLRFSAGSFWPLTDYEPGTGPWNLQQADTNYRANAGSDLGNVFYINAIPNPDMAFAYPSGNIDEALYFARYPDIRTIGWARTAREHFESMGSREGRDPLVPVNITGSAGAFTYSPSTSPDRLHNADRLLGESNGYIGGFAWIERGRYYGNSHAPITWTAYGGFVFDEALYLARYPDVANNIAAGGYASGWEHFTRAGSYEGRDPYAPGTDHAITVRAMHVGPYYINILFQFPTPGEYDLQVVRVDKVEDGTDNSQTWAGSGYSTSRYNESSVVLLKSATQGLPIQCRLRHTMLEMRVQASEQLQGVVQNLSAVATSILTVTDDGVTFRREESRNPAWIALDILTSERNPRPISYDAVDWTSWVHLARVCDSLRSWVVNGTPYTAPRYTCDIVVADFTTVKALVESVLSGCRASLILTSSGKWGVLHDEAKTVPRQVITPANSWGFGGSRTYMELPHALRVAFVNRDNGWNRDEVTVYADGYTADNAEVFESLDTYGVTDYPHAWAYGRYMLAQGLLRNELFTVSMDVENLLVQRGDLVRVAHDAPLVGGLPSRVRSVTGNTIDANIVLGALPTGYCVRLHDGTIRTGAVVAASGTQYTLDNAAGIEPDDLIVLGDYTRETYPYLVQRITPGADLSAELTLCRYVPEVYNADQGSLPEWDPGFGTDYLGGTDLIVENLTAAQALYYVEQEPRIDIALSWNTVGYDLARHEVARLTIDGRRIVLADDVLSLAFRFTVDALRDLDLFGVPLVFEVTPISRAGWRGRSALASLELVRDAVPPAPVLAFGVNVQKETVDIFWTPPQEPDIAAFVIRYSPNTTDPVWEAAQLLASVAWPGTKVAAGARTGAYGIRVADTSGNLSPEVWRFTTVATLPELNVITVLNDRDLFPTPWAGDKDHVIAEGAVIRSEGAFGAVYPVGYYYFDSLVDLGEVFEVRISSKIEAYATTGDPATGVFRSLPDMREEPPLPVLAWDAWLEVRTSDGAVVMADWPTLSVVDPIAVGTESGWSSWRPCAVGDYTAQLLQFRIVLASGNPGLRVVVFSGRVEVDMPDRVDTFGDLAVPAGGLDFVFPVAFRHLESVAVTIDGNAAPVVAEVSNKTAEGVRIMLRNTTTASYVAGTVDLMAEGYGRRGITSI